MDNILFNKLLNEKFNILKEITKEKNYNEELLCMLTFIYVAFYLDLGKTSDYPLYDLFNNVNIIFGTGTTTDIGLRNGIPNIPSDSAAITNFTPNFDIFFDASVKQNPQTIILGNEVGNCYVTPIFKLEMLCHEIRHALMGYNNSSILLDSSTYYMRSGLNENFYKLLDRDSKKIDTRQIGLILDEVTNTYITERLINIILSFKKYKIDNNQLSYYLQSLTTSQTDGKYRAIGYQREVKLMYPLLLNDMFIDLVDFHQFDGQIDIIKQFISENLDGFSYLEFSTLFDTIGQGNRIISDSTSSDFVSTHIDNIKKAKSLVLRLNENIKRN